jgi:subfamily B ATP-binding cassette protein MsbA
MAAKNTAEHPENGPAGPLCFPQEPENKNQ